MKKNGDENMPISDELRARFCQAARNGKIEEMKPYLDEHFSADPLAEGMLVAAFSFAVQGGHKKAIDLLLDYTDKAGLDHEKLEFLAGAHDGMRGLKLYQAAAKEHKRSKP